MMRNSLFEFFQPSKKELDTLWQQAIIVPDANVLLNLLRFNTKASNEVLRTFSTVKDRVWIPHQVAHEFLDNNHKVFLSMERPYDKLDSIYKDISEKLSTEIDNIKNEYRHHPSLDFESHKIEVVNLANTMRASLSRIREKHPKSADGQSIVELVAELFAGRVGPSLDGAEREEHQKEAAHRASLRIPPGFEDYNKSNGGFGDYIIWSQILTYAASKNSDIIFITDDSKDDWWLRVSGKTIGPRPELRREFYERTKKQFYMYNLARWLEIVREKRKSSISTETVDEARQQFIADSVRAKNDVHRRKATQDRLELVLAKLTKINKEISTVKDITNLYISKLNKIEHSYLNNTEIINGDVNSLPTDQMDVDRKSLLIDIDLLTERTRKLESERSDAEREYRDLKNYYRMRRWPRNAHLPDEEGA